MGTTVKYFHSAMSGAPVLSGTAGALIAVLDACLKDGFGLKTADSVVVSGGVATVSISTGHIFEQDMIVLVAGATPSGLNGEKTVLSVTTNTFTFDATGISDQTATGTITVKLSPAGWDKPFSGTNLAVYRAADVTGNRAYLRVDDTGTTNARVVGYEAMTDANTGTGPFPTAAQVSGGGYWPKASAANGTARSWTLIADSKSFYLHMSTQTTTAGVSGSVWSFGDFASYKSGDAYAAYLNCAATDQATSTTASATLSFDYTTGGSVTGTMFVPRSYTGVGSSISAGMGAESYISGAGVSGQNLSVAGPTYPNGPNNGLILTRKVLYESTVCLRGYMRGGFVTGQNCNTAFAWRDKITGQGDYAGKRLLAVKAGSPAGTTSQGVVFFDISGPWA